jgi:hypothetical protein
MPAMCTLGIINSRMKDYCDLIAISRGFEIDGQSLTEAIRATFQRRGTPLPDGIPTGLSEEFAGADNRGRERIPIPAVECPAAKVAPVPISEAGEPPPEAVIYGHFNGWGIYLTRFGPGERLCEGYPAVGVIALRKPLP